MGYSLIIAHKRGKEKTETRRQEGTFVGDDQDDYLCAFPVKHLGRDLHIDLVSYKNVTQPYFIGRFIDVVKDEVPAIARADAMQERL